MLRVVLFWAVVAVPDGWVDIVVFICKASRSART